MRKPAIVRDDLEHCMETKLENPCPLFLAFSLEFLLCFSMRVSISAILMHAIFFHLLVCFVSSVFSTGYRSAGSRTLDRVLFVGKNGVGLMCQKIWSKIISSQAQLVIVCHFFSKMS